MVKVWLMSIYTGHDKATVENHLNFVSVRHKQNEASVYCQGFVMLCRIASSVDSITDYNVSVVFCRAAMHALGVGMVRAT